MHNKALTYKKAKNKPKKRQAFLDQFFADNPSESVEALIYDHNKDLSVEYIYKLIEQQYLTEKEAEKEAKEE